MKYRYVTYLSNINIDDGYGEATVHYTNLENLRQDTWKVHADSVINSEKIYILCAHSDEYVFTNTLGILDQLDNRLIILFTYPKVGSYAHKRHANGHWYRPEETPYTPDEFVAKINSHGKLYATHGPYRKPDTDHVITIDTDLFVSDTGFDYIKQILDEKLGLELPESGRELHSLWFNAVKLISVES
jgi:hypothetical protein